MKLVSCKYFRLFNSIGAFPGMIVFHDYFGNGLFHRSLTLLGFKSIEVK